MPRLFIAIALPDAVHARLAALRPGMAGVRWNGPQQTHLTLRFLGEVDESLVPRLREALVTIQVPQFELRLQGVGCFPSLHNPRVLWAGVRPHPTLSALHEAVAIVLEGCGVPAEVRAFTPHVTVARLQAGGAGEIGQFLEANRRFHTEPFPVREFALYFSRLSPGGAIPSRVASFPLARSHEWGVAWPARHTHQASRILKCAGRLRLGPHPQPLSQQQERGGTFVVPRFDSGFQVGCRARPSPLLLLGQGPGVRAAQPSQA